MAALVDLCHHRWAIPVIAALYRERGGRFAALSRRLGVSRESLRQTLGALIERDLVLRNPGYGHPLRPEYLLSPFGERIGAACFALEEASQQAGVAAAMRRKWSAPALGGVALGAERFSEVRDALEGVTPRALTLALTALEEAGLVRRTLRSSRPPRAAHALTERGRVVGERVVGLLRALKYAD